MKIYLASDHGGYWLKESLKQDLRNSGREVVDVGNTKYDPGDDYTDFVFKLAESVAKEPDCMGIVLGRSGNGEAIAANKVVGIRAAVCTSEVMAKKARDSNNANILSLGADYVNAQLAERIVRIFVDTPFAEEIRHQRRNDAIASYEMSR